MSLHIVHPHGTVDRYKYNACRCDDCRAANTERMRQRRRAIAYGRWQGLIEATGTTRRLQALAAIGWTGAHVARLRGVDPSSVREHTRGEHPQILASIAREYALLYDELCTEDGPSKKSIAAARKKGWHGPEAWTDDTIDDPNAQPLTVDVVDEVAVQRAIDGDEQAVAALNKAERVEAARRLVRRGAGSGAIARHLGLSGTAAAKLVGAVRAGEAA